MSKATTILLYGRSGAGKSTQIAELAEKVFVKTRKPTRLYTADRGSLRAIQPHIDAGVIEVVEINDTDPWVFLNMAVRGKVRDNTGKWIDGNNSNIGCFAFESMTSFADELMNNLAEKAAQGLNIGGSGNVNFTVGGDQQTLKIGGNNMAHYGVVQTRITNEVWVSQKLPAEYVIWTASVSKEDDTTASGKVLGVQVAGKAMALEVFRWFHLSFRIDTVAAQQGKPERHILFLGNSVDMASGNAVSLGNTRVPLGGPPLPDKLEPASISKALDLIDAGSKAAGDALTRRLGTAKIQTVDNQKTP